MLIGINEILLLERRETALLSTHITGPRGYCQSPAARSKASDRGGLKFSRNSITELEFRSTKYQHSDSQAERQRTATQIAALRSRLPYCRVTVTEPRAESCEMPDGPGCCGKLYTDQRLALLRSYDGLSLLSAVLRAFVL